MKYVLEDIRATARHVFFETGSIDSVAAAVLRVARLDDRERIERQAPGPILEATCKHFDIRIAELVGPRRIGHLVRARKVAAFLMVACLVSIREVADRLGRRSHGFVPDWCREVEADSELRADAAAVAELASREYEDIRALPVIFPKTLGGAL